jgi:hypothetical protein
VRGVPPKRRWTLKGLHGVISQKMVFFITTAVRTSNPATNSVTKWSSGFLEKIIVAAYYFLSITEPEMLLPCSQA